MKPIYGNIILVAITALMALTLLLMIMGVADRTTVTIHGEVVQKFINSDGDYMMTINDTERGLVNVKMVPPTFHSYEVGDTIWLRASGNDIEEVKS